MTAFNGSHRIASGDLLHVATKCKELLDRDDTAQILVFDDVSSELIEIDFRSQPEEPPVKRAGRPKLGVVPREVTLLPKHWDWLATQPGGASVALRKLVEQGIKANRDRDALRLAQESAYRFMSAMAGNEPGFEEAIRALFANQKERFETLVQPWPSDIRDHATNLAASAFEITKGTQ